MEECSCFPTTFYVVLNKASLMRQSHINSCFKPCSIWAFFLGSGRNIVNPACLWVKKKRNISTIVKLIMINKTQWQWKLPLHFPQLCFAFSFVSFLFSFCSLFLICFMTSRWIVCRSWGPRVCVMSGKTHIQYTKGKKNLENPFGWLKNFALSLLPASFPGIFPPEIEIS